MKKYYEQKIKNCEEKIAFFEKILDEEKKELERCKKCGKEGDIEETVEKYKKQLIEENKNVK